ncbi:SLBB domain-containing protein [Pseudoalteromonas sp. A757]|uniref:SLBB domain-containing protein n=1 Tax=Pseudoalteromonas sp. A757 TaxID=2250709 RepID=UPI000FFEA6EB|nr:SLBB domain-containing protein [Pseudoalteromonas sp. A757]RXE84545.1 polysaccharide biosynthesis protein [Pseudoalteromonas sp. A757]
MLVNRLLLLLIMLFACSAAAFTPTKQQIEQFKKLPKSQQQLLAKQYGIDISTLNSSSGGTTENQKPEAVNMPQPQPEKDYLSNEEKRFKPEQEDLKPFGSELFSGNTLSETDVSNVSVPQDYILGAGDQLKVSFFGQQSFEEIVEVDGEGHVKLSELGPVSVTGMQYSEFKKLLQDKVSRELIGTSVYVSLTTLKKIRVLVVGEVKKPGSYTLSSLSNITHSIYTSGGLTDIGSFRNIQLKRKGKVIKTLDLYDLLLSGDNADDAPLRAGDTVFVPSLKSQVRLEGAVRREAIFEVKEGESLADLMIMSGGMSATAFKNSVTISRYTNGTRTVIGVERSEFASTMLKDGDAVKVDKTGTHFDNEVTLIGAVVRPGKYAWKPGLTISELFNNSLHSVLPQADTGYGLVLRGGRFEKVSLVQFNLLEQLRPNTNKKHLVELQSGDKVFVFSRFQYLNEEKDALKALDLTADELEQQEKTKLWHLYENELFKAFVDTEAIATLNQGQKSQVATEDFEEKSEPESENWSFMLPEETNAELDTKTELPSPFSRISLLEPVIRQLQHQATPQHPLEIVTIQGRVKYPGNYPIASNYTVKDAIEAAGGLLESAYLGLAELTTFKNDESMNVEHRSFDLAMELKQPSITIKSKDAINILSVPKWMDENQVTVKGEVKFPGTYTIKRGETLNDVLARAGGLTEFASIDSAVFTREEIKNQEQEQLKRLTENLKREIASKSLQPSSENITYSEVKQLLKDLSTIKAQGRLVINLPSIMNGRQSLVLQDGDTLYIPQERDSISVIGEVNYPASHLFEQGLSLSEYLERSGGIKELADEERIYIIKANGSVIIPKNNWFAVNREDTLSAGDTIVVPLNSNYMDNLTLWSTTTQIIYQLGVAAAAINNI